MSNAVSFAEIDEWHVELLPERTVMSTIFLAQGETAGESDNGTGSIGIDVLRALGILAPGTASAGDGDGGGGGSVAPAQ